MVCSFEVGRWKALLSQPPVGSPASLPKLRTDGPGFDGYQGGSWNAAALRSDAPRGFNGTGIRSIAREGAVEPDRLAFKS